MVVKCSGAQISDEKKKELTNILGDIGKLTSNSNKLVMSVESGFGKRSKVDKELLEINLEKLKSSLEEAEEALRKTNDIILFLKSTNIFGGGGEQLDMKWSEA